MAVLRIYKGNGSNILVHGRGGFSESSWQFELKMFRHYGGINELEKLWELHSKLRGKIIEAQTN